MIPPHTVPSLSGTLAKRTKPTLKPNFAKKPLSPSRSNAMTKKHCSKSDSETSLRAWYHDAKTAEWKSSNELKQQYTSKYCWRREGCI